MFPPWSPADFQMLCTKLNDEEYPIRSARRGKCIIFNYKCVQPDTHRQEGMETDEDVVQLSLRFGELGFEIITYSHLTRDEALRVLQQHGHDDYTQDDCFVCWILTPAQNSYVCTDNGDVLAVEHFVRPFCENQELLGKPKLFFIQACSGGRVEEVEAIVGIRARYREPRTPADADVLVACSTVPGYFSCGTGVNGSLFVQAFCCVLETSTGSDDLLAMLMEAYRVVALSFEVNNPSQHYTYGTEQMPYVTSTLTRRVCFPRIPQI
ncbi:caspase-7-like isoform X2 [Haemaphysalis longicornis]